jgi:hypothetical protein
MLTWLLLYAGSHGALLAGGAYACFYKRYLIGGLSMIVALASFLGNVALGDNRSSLLWRLLLPPDFS